MTRHTANTAIITDQQAEGSPQSREEREPLRATQTIPVLRQSPLRNAPVAETGMVAAVRLSGEGADDSDTQDATRTTAETQLSPNPLEAAMQISALIVEDTEELAEILQVTLTRMQIHTVHESHVSRASARIKEMHPDLILLDIGLPDGPGWKVLDNIKEQQRDPDVKPPVVIVISAYGDPANRLVGKLHGVYSYLIKPFTPHEVERTIRNALSSAAG